MNLSYCSSADVVVLLDEISSILQHISTNWKAFVCRISLQPAYFPESCRVLGCLFWDKDEQKFLQLTSSYLLFMTSNCLHVVLTNFRWESSKIYLYLCSVDDYQGWFIIIHLIFHSTQITCKIQAEGTQGLTEHLCVYINTWKLEKVSDHAVVELVLWVSKR